jgi:hypothetical protein
MLSFRPTQITLWPEEKFGGDYIYELILGHSMKTKDIHNATPDIKPINVSLNWPANAKTRRKVRGDFIYEKLIWRRDSNERQFDYIKQSNIC